MRLLRRLGLPLLLLTVLPATAGASIYSQVLRTYQESGSIPPCLYTGAQLATALKGVDVYGQQYFSDFTNAIQSALAQRAGGACAGGGGGGGAAVASDSGGPPFRLPPVTAATGAGVPLPLLALSVIVLLGLLAATASGLRRALGRDAASGGPWGHLWAEAGWRGAGAWADFEDWLRPGRAGGRGVRVSRRAPRPRG
ncbi:MAG TPA: hypothetical protein VLP43_05855 [Solirubrobacteraceae bacterium]|nr:hypothetical protein [Solirubrobacteraceae bacterium]